MKMRDRKEQRSQDSGSTESEPPAGVSNGPLEPACGWQPAGTNYWLLVGLTLAAACFMRLAFLGADPPWDFTWSQDVFTDGARVVDGARNKILFGHWITDPRSPVILYYPISNLLAWVVFKAGGVGLVQANLTGVLPALASLVLMFTLMRKLEGNLGGLLGLITLGFSHVYVIFGRIAMVESLIILMLLGSFWLALGGRRNLFLSGLLLGIASLMVKLHALHLAPVVLAFLVVDHGRDRDTGAKKAYLALSFIAGLAVAFGFWLVTIYAGHTAMMAKYFKSNVLLSQSNDYRNVTLYQAVIRRLSGLMHVGAGRDGYFVKVPELSIAAFLGLMGVVSRFSWRRTAAPRWELLSGIWFVGLVIALSLLGYRPLRYIMLFTPSVCLLAASLLLRLARGEPWLAPERPRWFPYVFGIWITWVMLHFQQDIVFQTMTGGRSIVLEAMNDFQKGLYKYQFAIIQQLLIFGGAGFLITLFLRGKLREADTRLPIRQSRRLFIAAVMIIVVLNGLRFTGYVLDRKYSIVNTAASLRTILPDNVFLVGDCANTVALETKYRGLPAYGDLMRYNEKAEFERYPVTHFLLRYPALFNYLRDNYPGFTTSIKPIRLYGLCGREATLLRFEEWPGYPRDSYRPTIFEQATELFNEGMSDDAIQAFQGFLELHPRSYEGFWGLAVGEMQRGDYEQAKTYIERSLELTKTDALSYEVYADVLQGLGQHELAFKYWGTALKYSPGNKRIFRKIGAATPEPSEEPSE